MNRKLFFYLVIVSAVVSSCQDKMEYRHADKPQPVNCSGADSNLMHEALYTFEEAIAKHYNFRNYSPTTPIYKQNGYAQFVYSGVTNTAPFVDIMDDHSRTVAKQLSKIDELWIVKDDVYTLNYKSKFVGCLIENVDNKELKEILAALVEAESVTPQLLAEPMRKNAVQTVEDPELAMIVALDAYFKNLLNRNLHVAYIDE